jgi:acetyltransferase-like isoleucine patch superfamily enzyme
MSLKTLFYVDAGAQIKLGDGVGISNTLFYASQSITVEDNVLIGGGCQILDNDFHSISYEDRMLKGDKNVKQLPILIKKGAFIGTCSIILKGVTIGERSIIAAGSVVTKSVPADQIWGGNPAQFIRNLTVH